MPVDPIAPLETILIAEDEPTLRALAEAVLADEGYRVLATASGAEALEICASHPEPIALLVTDMMMPGMGGPELLARARALRPELRVLGTSGYNQETLSRSGTLPAWLRVLEKPYAIEELLTAVRTTLDAPTPSD
jgi:two-component system cell cycle sensor histidine kinase/response regulator CckA